MLASIFEISLRPMPRRHGDYGGTGLGLSLSRRVAKLMGGALGGHQHARWAARFYSPRPLSGDAVERRFQAEVNNLRGKTVLIVDDNPSSRVILQEALSAWD